MAEDSKSVPKKSKKTPVPKPPKLVLPEDLVPIYVNLVRISHTPSELVYDFSRMLPGDKSARVESRVLMSPLSAKLFNRALTENLARYEATYGEITIPNKYTLADRLFRSVPPEQPPEE